MKKVLNIIIIILAVLILLAGAYGIIEERNVLKSESNHGTIATSGSEQPMVDSEPIQEIVESPPSMKSDESQEPEEPVTHLPKLSATQIETLQSLSAEMAAGDRVAAAETLSQWKLMLEEESDGAANTLQGYSFDGSTVQEQYTGTALASDNANRFYYGVLTDGIPDGSGCYLVLHNNQFERTTYLWIAGTWSRGILTGNFQLFIDEIPLSQPDAMRDRMEMVGVVDGSEQEIFLSTHVTQYTVLMEWDETGQISTPICEFQVQYDIQNGKLVETQWTSEDHKYLRPCTEIVNGITAFVGVTDWMESQFQNPYPWDQEYRFAYKTLFGAYPKISQYSHSF